MMKFLSILGILFFFCSPAFGQEVPRVEIFGGYSYLNYDLKANTTPTNGDLSRESFNGWEASATVNLNRWFGLEGDLSGHYKSPGNGFGASGLVCKDFSFMGGPRFAYRKGKATIFTHVLFGADHGSGTVVYPGGSFSPSDTPFAMAAGGGFDYAVRKHISIRIGQVDYFMTRHFLTELATQNNFRVSAGVVFTFGGRL